MRKTLQVYRRGATYWWRQILSVDKKKIEIRFSLQTLDHTTAKRRAAAMITATGAVKDMMEFVMRPLDARPTEKELKAMLDEVCRAFDIDDEMNVGHWTCSFEP